MKRFAPLVLAALALGLSACQSTPDPVLETQTAPSVPNADLMEFKANGKRLPNFEPAATCPFTVPDNLTPDQYQCGFVEVRESRRARSNRTIKIAVLAVKNLSGQDNLVANIYLQGGPGVGSQDFVSSLQDEPYRKTLTSQYDFILFDQRGAGQSQPRLECPAAGSVAARAQSLMAHQGSNLDPQWDKAIDDTVARNIQCRDALKAKGYNLSAYNTFESAADVNDIRKALGYKQLNLWGISYGTYLAQIVMRDYPSVVRSVDMEAIIDPTQDWSALAPLAFDRSRLEVFKACANNAACNAAFPNINATFDELMLELNKKQPTIDVPVSPTETIPVQVNGDMFLVVLNQLLYISDFLPQAPIYIALTKAGNYAPFARLLSFFLGGDGSNANGMYYSVLCSDTAQFTSEQQILRHLEKVTPAYRLQLGFRTLVARRTCNQWGVPADPFARFPIASTIPTLLQVGFFDPITPPSYAEGISRRLFNKTVAFYPAGSHGATTPFAQPGSEGACAQGLLSGFFANPKAKLDTSCAKKPLEFFVPVAAQGARTQSVYEPQLPAIRPVPLIPLY
jgi:pimeloyl-ACP methyl ester carboxylesterase